MYYSDVTRYSSKAAFEVFLLDYRVANQVLMSLMNIRRYHIILAGYVFVYDRVAYCRSLGYWYS